MTTGDTTGSGTAPTAADARTDARAPAWLPEGNDLARAFLARAREAPEGRTRAGTGRRRGAGVGRGMRRPADDSPWSGAAPDDRDPQPLAGSVERLVHEHGWGTELRVHGVLARWDLVVGASVAAHCKPERYADTELVVRAASTAWATQLRHLAPSIVRRLNEELGDGTVTRITVLGPTQPSWVRGPRRVKGRGPRDTYG
jgi:predicted nucleic acid-binding Zn ribbon protein